MINGPQQRGWHKLPWEFRHDNAPEPISYGEWTFIIFAVIVQVMGLIAMLISLVLLQ